MGNIIPPQTRTIDPYSSYNSNIVNQLTRMVSKNTNCLYGSQSMNVSVDTTNPTTGLIVSSGICFKDDVIIEINDNFYVDMHDVDFYFSSDHFDEIGFYYIALKYTYVKSKPPPVAKITIFKPSERGLFNSAYLFLKAVYVDGTPGNLSIISTHDYDPENTTIIRTYTQTQVSVEEVLPFFDANRDEGRLIYVRMKDNVYFGASQGWLAWDSVKDNLDTIGCPIGSLIYLNGNVADLARATSIETFAIGVVIKEGLALDGSGIIKLFGKCDNILVESGITLSPGDKLYLSEIEAGRVTSIVPIPYSQFIGVCTSFDILTQTCSIWFMPGSSGGGSGYSGFSGYSGRSGFSGIGLQGYSGFSGYSGRSGFSGPMGSGYSGLSGYSGIPGNNYYGLDVKINNYIIQINEPFKTIMANSESAIIFTLPSVTSAQLGIEYTLGKIGKGQLIIQASDNDTIEDSGPGKTIYCKDEDFAIITLKLISETQWVLKTGGNGTWITTY